MSYTTQRVRVVIICVCLLISAGLLSSAVALGHPAETGKTTVQPAQSPGASEAATTSTLTQTATTTPKDSHPTDAEAYNVSFIYHVAQVRYNCTYFAMNLSENAGEYTLVLTYREESKHEYVRFRAGPIKGPIADAFGDTDLLLLTAEVRIWYGQSVYLDIPRQCR